MNKQFRTTGILLLLALTELTALADDSEPSVIGYFEEVAGQVEIRDAQSARAAMAGELVYEDEQVVVGPASLALLILTADGFRAWSVAENSDWAWGDYQRESDSRIELVVSKDTRPGGVMRADEVDLSWSLPRQTALAVLPLKLDWRTDSELILPATVSLENEAGELLESFSANGAATFPRSQPIEPDTLYRWTVKLEDATAYTGTMTLLSDNKLETIQARYYDIPEQISDDEARVIHYKALILIQNELYLEAGKLLKEHAERNPEDTITRAWLLMLSNLMAQK